MLIKCILSKNDPLQDKKAAQEKERESRIAEAEVLNLQGVRHQEGLKLAQKLATKQLQIKEISSDGHCMYRAIEDQLAQRTKVLIVIGILLLWLKFEYLIRNAIGKSLHFMRKLPHFNIMTNFDKSSCMCYYQSSYTKYIFYSV